MKYLCLAIFDAKKLDLLPKNESDMFTDECLAYNEALHQSGHYLSSQMLQSVDETTTVCVRNGKVSVLACSFAETKEQLGGFILINARDLNDAIQVASKMPLARVGSIEIRPILERTEG